MYINVSLSLSWDLTSRYNIEKRDRILLDVIMTVHYKLTDWLSTSEINIRRSPTDKF